MEGKSVSESIIQCSICYKSFKNKGHLTQHGIIHTGKRPFACAYCEQRFVSLASCSIHEGRHVGAKKYFCKICDKNFVKDNDLKKHQCVHSEKKKPHPCILCHRTFKSSQGLKRHMCHNEELPYKCTLCGKIFDQKPQLINHLKVHTGEKAFECSICMKKCFSERHLKSHMVVHKTFECTVCNKKCSKQGYLTRHERSHAKKRYSCHLCTEEYSFCSSLIQHLKKIHAQVSDTVASGTSARENAVSSDAKMDEIFIKEENIIKEVAFNEEGDYINVKCEDKYMSIESETEDIEFGGDEKVDEKSVIYFDYEKEETMNIRESPVIKVKMNDDLENTAIKDENEMDPLA